MNHKRLTLQKTLAITILLIGVIGIGLVIATDYTYRKVAYQQQTDSLNQLIGIKSADLIKKLTERQKELGFKLQNEPDFTEAFNTGNKKGISYWLDQEFNRYHVTTGLIKLEKILIYDENFQLITYSDRGLEIDSSDKLPCPQIVNQVSVLPSIQRTKPKTMMCRFNGQPLLTTMLSIGSIKAKGYIQLISDPAHILTKIEPELGIPLKIFNSNNALLHQSINWPTKNEVNEFLLSNYKVRDEENNIFLVK